MPNNHSYQLHEQLTLGLLVAAMLTAPLLLFWQAMISFLVIEFIGACLLIIVFWRTPTSPVLARLAWLTLLIIVLLPLVYLIPIPENIWEILPGRERYKDSLILLQENGYSPKLSLSLSPQRTLHAAVVILPLMAILVGTATLSIKNQIKLAYIFLAIACLQAIFGLIQYSNPGAAWAHLGRNVTGSAHGTYLNRDHFSMLMHASLPIAVGLLMRNIGNNNSGDQQGNLITKLPLNTVFIFIFIALMILLGGIFSNSRAGVFLTISGIIVSTLLFARHIGGKRSAGMAAMLATIGIGSAISIGLIPILNRFIVKSPTEDLRWTLFEEAIKGIKLFFPLGSGPGTFQDIYRTIQPVELLNFMNHVHNDYLELVFETGAIGILILMLILLSIIQGWINLRSYPWNTYRFIKVASGISLILIALHSLVDFNLHTPANAVFAAMLAGLFLSRQKS